MDDFYITKLEDIESDLRTLRSLVQRGLTHSQLNMLTEAQNNLRALRESAKSPVLQ